MALNQGHDIGSLLHKQTPPPPKKEKEKGKKERNEKTTLLFNRTRVSYAGHISISKANKINISYTNK